MNTEKAGLPASVLLIGLVYAVALDAAPRSELISNAGPVKAEQTAAANAPVAAITAGSIATPRDHTRGTLLACLDAPSERSFCPYAYASEISSDGTAQAHYRLLNRQQEKAGVMNPDWRKTKILFF